MSQYESKEKRPRYNKAKDHRLQEKGIVVLRESLSSLASLSPENLEKRVDDIQNKVRMNGCGCRYECQRYLMSISYCIHTYPRVLGRWLECTY